MILKYISKSETIILVVVPCNVDITTTEALRMALHVDPEGHRTLGLQTYCISITYFLSLYDSCYSFAETFFYFFFMLGLAILTKPDLIDKGAETDVLKIVQGKVIPLSKG